VTFNVRNAYGSSFGTQQHAEMSVSFDFSTVEAELDRAEEEIEQRGGRHAAALKEFIAQVRVLHEGGKSVGRGSFARHLEVIQRKDGIRGPIVGNQRQEYSLVDHLRKEAVNGEAVSWLGTGVYLLVGILVRHALTGKGH
jgi:hypothetical protein